ncbi:MAG: phytanoyl-CoA dioxygenase family protein [Phycisphaerales bacterium]
MQADTISATHIARSVLQELDTPMVLNLEQIEAFRVDGFIRLKQVFSSQTLREYERIITESLDEKSVGWPPLDQRDTYGKAFIQVENIWQCRPRVRQIVLSHRLGSIVTQLLGVKRIRLYHDHALYKEAGGGITPWHADQRYWPLGTDLTLTVWIPLQPTPQSMGALEYAAGSHRLSIARDLPISDRSEEQIAQSLQHSGLPLVKGDFELGEASFHYGWTFHRAPANTGSQVRKALSIMYYADGSKVKAFTNDSQRRDAEHFLQNAQPGDDAVSELNPLLCAD